jgi:hypothetical protein
MPEDLEEPEQQYIDFCGKAERALNELFSKAQAAAEVQFAFALSPEMRGMQDAGWNTAVETFGAVEEFMELINSMEQSRMKVRVALSLYAHVSEASGFYEVPKNMMRIASGEDYHLWPFRHLVQGRRERGAIIAPNANKVMKDLIGHADELGLTELKSVLLEAFDPDLRNGYAHADYIIWGDGIRLRKRNGGHPRVVTFEEFSGKLDRALAFFDILKGVIATFIRSYHPEKRVLGAPNHQQMPLPTIIKFDPDTGAFSIRSGLGL